MASLCLTPIAPGKPKRLDLSPDESGGTEFSLILFSFSKECLTGNHHRSKHTGVHNTKWIQNSGVLGLWGEQGTARHCPSIAREQWAEAPNLGATRGPKPAPCPTVSGHTGGRPSLLHQSLGTLNSCSNSHVPYLWTQVGKAATPQQFPGDSLGLQQNSAILVGPLPLHIARGPCWKEKATL